jgi:ribosomal protein L37AE/L43A
MRIWGHRYNRDLQRYNLALRMIAHEARTHTICDWTGLPDDRIRNLYQSYYNEHGRNPTSRRRGPSPQSLGFFFVSARSRSETAAIVGLCYLLNVLPGHMLSNPRRELPSIARGERLCEAYDMYQALVPGTLMSLEHVVLLIMTVAHGHEFQAGHCVACGGVIVIDRSSLRRWNCTHCGDRAARGDAKAIELIPVQVAPEDVQRDLFADANQRPEKRRIKK